MFLFQPRRSLSLLLLIYVVLCAAEKEASASFDSTADVGEQQSTAEEGGGVVQAQQEQHRPLRINESWPTTDLDTFINSNGNAFQQEEYEYFMKGCAEFAGRELCEKNERDRLATNALQPSLMKNFTEDGYAKFDIPSQTMKIVYDYLETYQQNLASEAWGSLETHFNHWYKLTHTHNIEFFMPVEDRNVIQKEVQGVLQGWCGVPLVPVSTYGIRVYREGSIVAPHVNRLPMVISAILNIAQEEEFEGEWPLEVISRDGVAVNLTLAPGEMIAYEGHSIIHGRPYPLEHWFYATVSMHFEPVGYSYELKQQRKENTIEQSTASRNEQARAMFHKALDKQQQTQKKPEMMQNQEVPLYVVPESEQEERFAQKFIFQREPKKPRKQQMTAGATSAHTVAANGDLDALKRVVENDPSVVDRADVNGWKPIHEAARGGQTKVLEYLIDKGVDVNERTHQGKGGSALWWAQRNFPDTHPAVEILRRHGAVALAPRD